MTIKWAIITSLGTVKTKPHNEFQNFLLRDCPPYQNR